MVVILLPAAAPSGVEQDRAGCPFTCTVQAPHSAMPQPYLVPVMPRWSRRTHRRGVSRSASTDMGLPLTFRAIIEELLEKNPPQLFSALPADLCRGQVISGRKPCHRDVPAGGREPLAGAETGPLAGLASASGAKVPSRWRWRPTPPRRPPPPRSRIRRSTWRRPRTPSERRLATRRRRLEPSVSDPGQGLAQSHRPRRRATRERARQRPAEFSPVLLFLGVRRPGLPDYRVERLRRAEKNPVVVPVRQRCERRARLGEEARQAALGGGKIRAPCDAFRAEFAHNSGKKTLRRRPALTRFAYVVRSELEVKIPIAR